MNEFLVSSLSDTLSFVLKEDLIDFYKDIASAQSNQFTILVAVIIGVFTVVIGATWWWNYKGAKSQINEEMGVVRTDVQQLSDELDKKFNAFKQEIYELIDQKIIASIDTHFSQKLDEYSDQISAIDNKNEELLNEFQETINKQITEQRAELSRVFALHCKANSSLYNAFTWWVKAFELYNEIENGKFAQISIKAALVALKDVNKDEVNIEEIPSYVERIKNGVPDILSSERKELLELLDKLCHSEDNK